VGHSRKWIVFATLAALVFAAEFAGAQKSKEREVTDWKPASLPADALRYGAELETAAPEEFKKWARTQVTQRMRVQTVEPKATMAAVDEKYPQAPETARDAGTFLLFHAAYKDEDENQRTLAYRIRDIDRETRELTRQLQVMWKNDQSRAASVNNSPSTLGQALSIQDQTQQLEARLREYGDERQLKATQLAASRKKINAYLKLLDMVHERMKDVPPAAIAGLQ